MLNIISVRHLYPEPNGLIIDRPDGAGSYTFLHFFQSINILYNGKMIEANPGAVIIYDKNTPQYFKTDKALVHNWMHISGDMDKLMKKYNLSFDTIYYPIGSDFITDLTYQTEFEFYGNFDYNKDLCKMKVEELLLKLSRSVYGQNTSDYSSKVKQAFQLLRRKMLSDLSKHRSVGELAKEVGFSESRFYRIYKSIYGISPANDMINARLEKAKELLFKEKMSISEIAERLGYENTTHFIRQFKQKNKVSPTEYRKGAQNGIFKIN